MVLWNGKNWIIGTTIVSAVLSVAISLWLPNIYRSDAVLAAEDQGGGLANLAAQYGGLASLAGISLPTNSNDERVEGIETLRSREFVTDFIARRAILPELMAARRYNTEINEIIFDSKDYDVESATWIRRVRPPYEAEPSLLEAYEEFMEIYSISEDRETGFVTVSIEHLSPLIARDWVDWIVEDINEKMMLEATSEARQAIEFLTEQLENTHIVNLEEVFYSLIEEQMKTIMLAEVRSEYLFKTIDPAVITEEEVKPYRALICIFGTIFGGVLATLGVLIRYYLFFAPTSNN